MKLCNLPPVGMRNIKTALSVFICLAAFAIMGPQYSPFSACIAAVICMGSSIEDSVEAGWNRILGTVIGSILGIFSIFICNIVPWDLTYMILIPIGIVGLIYLCTILNMPGAIIISCVMLISVLITYPQDSGSYYLAFLRLLETGFGVMVAFLINMFIKTPDHCESEKECQTENEKNENSQLEKKEIEKESGIQKLSFIRFLNTILKP